MNTEIEAKWLAIDHDEMRKMLKSLGATLVQPEQLMIRKNFDFEDNRLDSVNGWVRVRDEGNKITLSYKQLNDRTLHGTKEVSVEVGSFNDTCTFLESIGLVVKSHQETKRESWRLGDAEIELDSWPWIPTFLEIEAPSEDILRHAAQLLSLNFSEAVHGSVEVAYQAIYNVSEKEVDNWNEITFSDVPHWLAEKSKT